MFLKNNYHCYTQSLQAKKSKPPIIIDETEEYENTHKILQEASRIIGEKESPKIISKERNTCLRKNDWIRVSNIFVTNQVHSIIIGATNSY